VSIKQQMMLAATGELPDHLPYAPRLDLWFQANKLRGTLPEKHKDAKHEDEIARHYGWGLHRVILKFAAFGEEPILDRTLGVYRIPTQDFRSELPNDVQRIVKNEGEQIKVEYITPKGSVRGSFIFSDKMKKSGVSLPIITEHLIKDKNDYAPVGYIFENMQVEPSVEGYHEWVETAGEDTLPIVFALSAGSPMHHIMKILVDTTKFYYHHRDFPTQILGLEEQIGVYFRKVYETITNGPAEAYMIGANFDDTITYAPFFRDHILPWIQEGSEKLHSRGKLSVCHTDGENNNLMDYIYDSGIDIADSVCPFPMTKLTIGEYYQRWSDRITIFGGIPSNFLLESSSSFKELESYLDDLLKDISPGKRFILGITDITPPDAEFDRLIRIGDFVNEKGRLPLEAGSFNPLQKSQLENGFFEIKNNVVHERDDIYRDVSESVLKGDNEAITEHVRLLLEKNVEAGDILNNGMLPIMEIIGEKFKDGTIFIPEVLLSARAMNEALTVLEPYLSANSSNNPGKILIGTVKGDLHDIGKNIVLTMLKGVGFKTIDLGMNVPAKDFIDQVIQEKPTILGLSALLTTTMPEMATVIEALKTAGLRDKVKIMVGGAPVTTKFAQKIGADAYAKDAGEAVEIAKKISISVNPPESNQKKLKYILNKRNGPDYG
jgi:corrinoid protein of di/trimethylamine methyltransferase